MSRYAVPSSVSRVLIGHDALQVEDLVLDQIALIDQQNLADPYALTLPVWLVVPSKSLRQHISSRIVQTLGRAVAGIEVTTLYGLAASIIVGCGEPIPSGGALFPVLVQRFAQLEPALARSLEGLSNAYAVVVGTVRDFFDAGFEPAHADSLIERLSELPDSGRDEVARSCAVVRVARATAVAMEQLGIGRSADVLRRANELLRVGGQGVLPTRRVLIHGFAEATGVASDLIESLVHLRQAMVFVEQPADPVDLSVVDLGKSFTARLIERLAGGADVEDVGFRVTPPDRHLLAVVGAEEEALMVARRAATLLDGGIAPESIGVVARDMSEYEPLFYRHFQALGVPFSVLGGKGSIGPELHTLRALQEVLQQGELASVDSFLAASCWLIESDKLDFRVGLRFVGAVFIADVAGLEGTGGIDLRGGLSLPVRRGLSGGGAEDAGEDVVVAPRRRLSHQALETVCRRAARLAAELTRRPQRTTLGQHLAWLRTLVKDELEWRPESAAQVELEGALSRLWAEIPSDLLLDRAEIEVLLDRALADAPRRSLGGCGSGVQVLGVMEARSRTFAHLFVVGLNRDTFPRSVREDPLLPDELRLALEPLLPDLPIKKNGLVEERYLFAQLGFSSPHVTLSYQQVDDDGKPRAISPFLQRMLLPKDTLAISLPARDDGPMAVREYAVASGMSSSREQFSAVLAMAIDEARSLFSPPPGGVIDAGNLAPVDALQLATARVAVLDELDPDRRTTRGRQRSQLLGPYLGLIGARGGAHDPRGRIAMTTVEGVAACPWQAFLRRLLRLEPPPDPLLALPGVDARQVGNVVHSVLEEVVKQVASDVPRALATVQESKAFPVVWPTSEVVAEILAQQAVRHARAAGLSFAGLGRVLVELAQPYIEIARMIDWPEEGSAVDVVAVEAKGEIVIGDARLQDRAIDVTVDRLDQVRDGRRVTEYKTGSPISIGLKPETRRKHFLQAVAKGSWLQVVASLMLIPKTGGRFVFLQPGDEVDLQREYAVGPEDKDFVAAFLLATRTVLSAWDAGAFFPRLVEAPSGEKPRRCEYCEVREACWHADSAQRRRLALWAEGWQAGDQAERARSGSTASALGALWWLGRDPQTTGEDREGRRE